MVLSDMRLDVTQNIRMDQQMRLAPRIIQAMEILQLPMMELLERIDTEMESNPVLEAEQPGVDDEAPVQQVDATADRGEQDMVVKESGDNSEDFERLSDLSDEYGPEAIISDLPFRKAADSGDGRDRKLEAMANSPAHEQSLDEYLHEQWMFVDTTAEMQRAGKVIIDYLDADGYLRVPLGDLATKTHPPTDPGLLVEALALVQNLDPKGVGARDLKECLSLQLRDEQAAGADVELELILVSRFLRDIEMNRLPNIARRTGRSVEEINAAISNLSHLNPRPGSLIGQSIVPVITPEIVVTMDDNGDAVVSMAGGYLPRLYVSKMYRNLAKDRATNREAKTFLKKNIRSAQWLIEAIAQRRNTVRRVAEEVFKVQRDFLHEGHESLKPLPMADIAAKVGVHVATVSRAVAGKHVQTPRGIFPLRMFFSGGTTTADGEGVSWDAVKVKLQEVIDTEDKSNPLKDDKLVEALAEKGVTIARRTIAKYRKLMNIPPARKRRQY